MAPVARTSAPLLSQYDGVVALIVGLLRAADLADAECGNANMRGFCLATQPGHFGVEVDAVVRHHLCRALAHLASRDAIGIPTAVASKGLHKRSVRLHATAGPESADEGDGPPETEGLGDDADDGSAHALPADAVEEPFAGAVVPDPSVVDNRTSIAEAGGASGDGGLR